MSKGASTNPDALGASGRFFVETLDGSTDVDIVGTQGGPSRQIKLLSTATGNLKLVQASPYDSSASETDVPLDNLPAGDVLNVQALRIVGGVPSGLKLLILCALAALALCLVGCATARDAAVVTLDGSAAFAASAEPALEELDRRDQEAIVDSTFSESEAKARLAPVRARYHKAWQAYRDYRAAWLAAAAAVRVYDDASAAKLSHSETDFVKAVADLVAAERELVAAVNVIRNASGGPAASGSAPSSNAPPPKPPAPSPAPAPSAAPAAPKPSGGAS